MFSQSTARYFDGESLLWHEMLLFICKPLCVCEFDSILDSPVNEASSSLYPVDSQFDTVYIGCHGYVDFNCCIEENKNQNFQIVEKKMSC